MIVPTADRSKATVMVKVRFIDKDSRILPEMSAKVAFLARWAKPEEQKPRTALHQTALVNQKDGKAIFLVKGDMIETPVNLGSPMGDVVEVLEVKVGDRVESSDRLKNGSKIKIERSTGTAHQLLAMKMTLSLTPSLPAFVPKGGASRRQAPGRGQFTRNNSRPHPLDRGGEALHHVGCRTMP
jgi:hypothetical protein